MYCKNCGAQIDDKAVICVHCGHQTTPPQKTANSAVTILLLIFFFPVGLYLMWAKTDWKKWVKVLVTVILAILVIGVANSANSDTGATSNTTDPSSVTTGAIDGATLGTTETTVPEETEPQIPEYILHILTEELLFSSIDVVTAPEGGEGTWEFSGDSGYYNSGYYNLTVTTNEGAVTSVIADGEHTLYENGSVVVTIKDHRANEYKNECQQISYEDLARNPDKYKGQDFTFTGEVIQVYKDGLYTVLRINVTDYTIGDTVFYKDTVYAKVYLESGADRILDDDIITIWGSCSGLITYESILGQQISIPGIDIYYYEIVS